MNKANTMTRKLDVKVVVRKSEKETERE